MPSLTREEFVSVVKRSGEGTLAIPISLRLLADQLTPVLAYRRLVSADERTAPSFLLESVEGGERQGRHSILGAQPIKEVIARGHEVVVSDHASGKTIASREDDPFLSLRAITAGIRLVIPSQVRGAGSLPKCFLAGWVGYAAYDTVRYAEPHKLAGGPRDDRHLPDLHFGLYDGVVIFDHVDKLVYLVQLAIIPAGSDPGIAYDHARRRLAERAEQIQRHSKPLPSGVVDREQPAATLPSNTTKPQHAAMIARAKEYIRAGDIFQVVLGQRFERHSSADPFDVYRALRAVNPSPYMVYLQSRGCILVASSPEILCRVHQKHDRQGASVALDTINTREERSLTVAFPTESMIITNRPLAGTRRRGQTAEEDAALERELLADPKERAEHIMLVDLGRNDVGQVAIPGTISLPRIMEVERYSHVMHISSTVTGTLRPGLDCWDALRAALPVGTISGAPKIRAMQIIDELEPVRRGPYGGGVGYVGLDGQMDIALTLRTMVVPTDLYANGQWVYHLQAAGGIVADSDPEAEYQETVNKAAALARAIELAERAFAEPKTNEPRTN